MLSFPQALRADDYPPHPIKLPVGALPGDATDTIARSIAGLANTKLQKRLKSEGAKPAGDTPADFVAFVRQDIERWAPIVKASGATPN